MSILIICKQRLDIDELIKLQFNTILTERTYRPYTFYFPWRISTLEPHRKNMNKYHYMIGALAAVIFMLGMNLVGVITERNQESAYLPDRIDSNSIETTSIQRNNVKPSSNERTAKKSIDLSNWKLTLPDLNASEIFSAELTQGFSNEYFTAKNDGLQFWCPVTGGTTKGSKYPRSELRETINANDDNVNWTSDGTHELIAKLKVIQAPSTGKVIIGQIHSFEGRPLIKLQWEKGRMKLLAKRFTKGSNEDVVHWFNQSHPIDSTITYRIVVNDGVVLVGVGDETVTHNFVQGDPSWSNSTFFFKAGAYCQDNSGPSTEGARVLFSTLKVTHAK